VAAAPAAAPKLSVALAGRSGVLRKRSLVLVARCDVACSLNAQGQLAVRGSRAQTPLSTKPRPLAAGKATRVALKLTKRGARLLAAALKRGRSGLVASLTIGAAAGGPTRTTGAATTVRRVYRVRR
jgi:hypothetical protein